MFSFKILETKSVAYIVCSIIPFLALSIFFADLICSIFSIFFLAYLIKKNPYIFYKNIFFLIALSFYFLCLVSSFLSGEILFSLKSSLPLIRIIIFIMLLSYLVQNNKYFLNIFYNFLKYTFSLLIIFGLIQYAYEFYNIVLLERLGISYVRLKLPFSDEEKLGSYLVRLYGLLIAIYILQKKFKKSENIYLFILTILVSIVILFSGERSSLFFLILFLLVFMIFSNIKLKFKISFSLLFFTIFFLILSQNENLSKRILLDSNNQLNFTFDKKELRIFTAQHTAHYLSGLEMFFDKPLIGQGPRMFRLLCDNGDFRIIVHGRKPCSSHPHSTYIQLLSETGFLGAMLFSLGFVHIIYFLTKHLFSKIFFKKKFLNDYQVIICASALLVFWPFSPSGNFFNNWVLIVCAFSVSLYFNEFFKYKNYKNL